MTPTGTNLLGLVKHLASVELGYFGDTFGRPHGIELPWQVEGADVNADMYATEDESREHIVGLYERAWEHAAGTFAAKNLDDTGEVPWWRPGHRDASPSTRSWSTWPPRPTGTPATPTSSAS